MSRSTTSISTVVATTTKLSWPAMPRCRWQQPELSIGAPCASLDLLGRYKCWSLKDKSPAHLVWKAVSKAITSLLDDQFEHLDAGGSDLMIEMFMVGRRMNSCSPTILFSCESKACRHKAMELVKKKAILASHPGVLMAESSRLPRLLALGEDSEILNLPPGVYGNGPFKSCGMPILISGSHGGALRKATLGGIICIDEDYYGVTTAHAFVETKQEGIREDGDIEFAFYGLGEPDDSTDDEDNSVEMTSQGSISSSSTQSLGYDELRDSAHGPLTLSTDSITTNQNSNSKNPVESRGTNEKVTPIKMGTLFATTLPEETLDWALVKIEYLAFSNLNPSVLDAIDELFWGPEVMYPKSIANEPLDCRVFICTGSSDSVIEGTLSSVASFSRLPGAKNFQQLWTVRRLDGEFSDGDCGSWVLNSESGKLFGHVVSGYPKTNTAYIIPAFEIFHEMQAYLRKPVQLSTAEKRSFLRRRFESAQIPKSTPPTSSGPEYNRKDKPPRTAYVEDIDESGKPVRGSRRSASIKGGKSLLRTKRSDNAIKLNSDLTQSNESTRQNDREAEKASKEKEKRKSPQALSSRPLNRDRDLKSPTSPRPGDSRTGDNSRSGIPPSIAPEALSFRPRAAVSQAYPRPESYRRPYAPGSHISGPPVSASAFSQPPLITPYYPLPYLSSHARYGVTPQNQWPGYAPRPPFPTRFDPVPRPSSAHSARHIPTYANYPHGYDTRYNDGYATLTGREPIVPAATPPPPRPGIPRRRDTETSRDLQRVQIDVESNKGLRRSYYRKSREYEDMDKFDTAASYQEDISGPRIPLTAEALRRQQQLEESGNNKSTRKIGRQIDSKRTSTTRATTRSVADDEEDVTIKFTGGELQIKRQKSIRGGNESSKYDRSTRRHLQIRRHTVRSRQDTPPGPVGGRSGEQTSSTLPPEESNLGTDSNIHAEIEPLETEKPKGISEVWDNIVVPPSIQASQSSLVGNMDQVQELQSLLDDIKTLLFEAKENDLLRGKSAELWKEAEEIIMLVGWDEGPPDPRSVLLDKEVLESEDDDSGHGTDDDLATQFSDTLGVPAAGEDIPTKGYPATSTPVLLNTTSQAPEKVLADVTSLQDLLYRVQHIHYLLRIETEDSIILKPNPQRGRHEYNHQYGEG